MNRLKGTRVVDWIRENAEEARRGGACGFAKATQVLIYGYLCKLVFVESAKCNTERKNR